jgi:hypothetical protein
MLKDALRALILLRGEERDRLIKGGGLGLGRWGRSGEARVQLRVAGEGALDLGRAGSLILSLFARERAGLLLLLLLLMPEEIRRLEL